MEEMCWIAEAARKARLHQHRRRRSARRREIHRGRWGNTVVRCAGAGASAPCCSEESQVRMGDRSKNTGALRKGRSTRRRMATGEETGHRRLIEPIGARLRWQFALGGGTGSV
jgi:hypothetical protein